MAALTAAQVARGRATCVILKAERRREVLQNRVDRTYYSSKGSGDKRDESACADIVCNGARELWSNLRRREQGGEHSEVHRGVWRPGRSSILAAYDVDEQYTHSGVLARDCRSIMATRRTSTSQLAACEPENG